MFTSHSNIQSTPAKNVIIGVKWSSCMAGEGMALSTSTGYDPSINGNYKEINMRHQLITAAFFMEGLHDARPDHNVKPNYDVLIETWGRGCIELVDTLVSYVPFTIKLCEAVAIVCDGNYPGVFDYEVSSSFGKWFGESILEHGDEPSQENAQTWLVIHIREFFTQGLTEDQAEDVENAINEKWSALNH